MLGWFDGVRTISVSHSGGYEEFYLLGQRFPTFFLSHTPWLRYFIYE
jgi:hypothetical protein